MGDMGFQDIQEFFHLGKIGFWKLEIEDGRSPRLYADAMMDELLGVEGPITPEQRHPLRQSRIHPDEMSLFQEYATDLLTRGSEIVYRYLHPTQGTLNVRRHGTRISAPDGIVCIAGYHQVVSGIVRLEPNKLLENQLTRTNKQLEEERDRATNYYRDLLDMQSCGVLAYTLPSHHVKHMNTEAMHAYGVSSVEEGERRLGELIGNVRYKDPATVTRLHDLRTHDGAVDYECTIAGRNGRLTEALAKSEIFTTPQGERLVVTTFLDISENAALKSAIQEAERASIAKTDFLRRMSHDIRTPINGIMGMVDIAEHSADDPDKQQECREKIRQASGYLLDLVNGILDMNKLESGAVTLDHKPVDIIEVVAQANSICQMNGQERALRITVNQPDVQHARLVGSPLHLRQIRLNIAGNAVKYSRPYGRINLSLRETGFAQGQAI